MSGLGWCGSAFYPRVPQWLYPGTTLTWKTAPGLTSARRSGAAAPGPGGGGGCVPGRGAWWPGKHPAKISLLCPLLHGLAGGAEEALLSAVLSMSRS